MYTKNYIALLIKDNTAETDVERKALFRIFSNDDLFGVCGKINVHTIAAQKYTTPQAA